ncbi:HrgA protein [uncultured Helicobacter sp.]|uniref:HrgA protein n=1 Tax=uncultured Helicobacter sp. TaxID=175537 RepID=UPI00374EA2A0
MSYTYLQLAREVLESSPRALQLGAIWKQACEKGLEKKLDSTNPTKQALSSVLRTELKRPNTAFFAKSKNPTLFGIKGKHSQEITDEDTQDYQEDQSDDKSFGERDLHPLFVKFANEKLGISCKTIYHERSTKGKAGQNKWLHPDIVGIDTNPYNFRSNKAFKFLEKSEISHIKLYSFELKKSIGFGDFKQSYFQAVSNSSWANEGYLVVFSEIEEEIIETLRKLNSRFGIGLIKVGRDIESFEVVISAKTQNLDPFMIDELADKNKDFESFLESIFERGLTKFVFDEVWDDEKLKVHIQKQV